MLDEVKKLKQEFREVLSSGLGKWAGPAAKIRVKPGTAPKFFKARPVPFAMRDPVGKELDRLVASDILEPVDHAEWASPIVPVPKKDGSIRI
jgi:hypothetical protein